MLDVRVSFPLWNTDKPRGACPGYVVDDAIPLCAGGDDDPLNTQCQMIVDARAKNREVASSVELECGENGSVARSHK